MNRTPSELTPDRADELTARDLSDACEATGTTNTSIACAWGCTEKIVRDVRAGLRPMTAGRALRLPARVRDEYLRRLAARCTGERAHPLTPEGQAQVVLGDAGEAVAALARALPGGIDPQEARESLASLRRLLRAGRELEEQLEDVARSPALRAVGGGE